MVITRLRVANYRSLGDPVDLRLGRLTALVGPNGSGKSNIVDVLRFVAEALRTGLEAAITRRHGIAAVRRWSGGRPYDVSIRVDVEREDGAGGLYAIELGSSRPNDYRVKREFAVYGHGFPEGYDNFLGGTNSFEVVEGQWKSGPPNIRPKVDPMGLVLPLIAADERFRPLADALTNVAIYSIFPDTLREPQKPDPVRPMNEHGSNWASILKTLGQESWAADLKAALGRITGDIDDVRVRQVGGYLVTEFRHGTVGQGARERPRWFEAAQESDGTLRMAGILTALLQEPPLTLVGVEEPELTIHPGALPLLHDYLAEASTRSQVLVTTHSPELLSCLDAESVRVVERRDGTTTVSPMDEIQREAVRDRLLTLGDLMRMEGLRPEAVTHDPQAGD